MSDTDNNVSEIPSAANPTSSWQDSLEKLQKNLDSFRERPAQQLMADAIEKAVSSGETLLCEAPTGTGKTYAYLVPLLVNRYKAIISTGTKTLQDQLYHRDLPMIRPFLGQGLKFALLKGRSNYLCRYRLELAESEAGTFDVSLARQLQLVHKFAESTQSGDLAECEALPEDAMVWSHVTSTVENCLGQECPLIGKCHVLQARKKAIEADVVVVNHHLLLADQALKEDGFGELLPQVDVVILDEAHQIPELAANFFSETFGSKQLQTLADDTLLEAGESAKDMGTLRSSCYELIQEAKDLRQHLPKGSFRGAWQELVHSSAFIEALTAVEQLLENLTQQLQVASARSKGLETCAKRAETILMRLSRLLAPQNAAGKTAAQGSSQVFWYETFTRSLQIHITPLCIAKPFQELMQRMQASWVFTSATLTTQGNFQFLRSTLGLTNKTTELILDTPFSYQEQGLLYVPRGLPAVNSAEYVSSCVEAAVPIIRALEGRTFFLFTSHRALQEAASILSGRIAYPLFVQGDTTRSLLLQQFLQAKNGILLGTASFWEGVDIRGSALSCVIIDKLPFASPGDPVYKARIDNLRQQGEDPFSGYQLPKAVIRLKQGAGRLIRDVLDIGILMICDPRMVAKQYGRDFLLSLPDFRRTRDQDAVLRFVKEVGVDET